MRKTYILDTNVLLHDPEAVFRFDEHEVVLLIQVLEELDKFKHEESERGRNARRVTRTLDALRGTGSLVSGVSTPGGGILRVAVPDNAPGEYTDNVVLRYAGGMLPPVTIVTQDINLRVRADAYGLHAEPYKAERVAPPTVGTYEADVSAADIETFYRQGELTYQAPGNVYANDAVMLRAGTSTALGRYDDRKGAVVTLRTPREGVQGLRPKNREQAHALDVLLDEDIKLVTVVGKAGTGKTLLALAAGLQRTVNDNTYTKVLVARPVIPMGKDIGYLPGDMDEKLAPWMQPIFDNLEFLYSNKQTRGARAYADLLEGGQLQVEPLMYIRGRSLPQQYIIIDEAQNLTPHEVKTIITRSGDGTKIVLTGDPEQIDAPYLDSQSNGLSVAAARFRGQRMAAHVTLTKGERSALADLATELL